MLKRSKMIISLERDGIKSNKEVNSFLSCSSMLKHLRKQAKKTDPWARIMELDEVPTLVCHRNGSPNKITVRLIHTETELK
ncbi:MAG: hypothetical protein ACK5LL_00060 [Suipraeoptans sp.]